MGNQTMAVQHDHKHEAMAKARLFKDSDDTDTEEIDDGYSPCPKMLNKVSCMPKQKGF
jgi:hypothetical protein